MLHSLTRQVLTTSPVLNYYKFITAFRRVGLVMIYHTCPFL